MSHIQNNPVKCRTAEHSELYQDDNYMIDVDTFLLHYGGESDPHKMRNKYLSNFIETLEMSYTVSLTKV